MEPDLNSKYKFVLRQVKKGTKYFLVRKVFKYNGNQPIKLTEFEDENLNAGEATDVKVFASLGPAFFSADDGSLSNLKVIPNPECMFEDQSIEDFWYGGILISGELYTQSGQRLNDVDGIDIQTGLIQEPLPPKRHCFKMTKRTQQTAAQPDYFKIDTNSIVDCDERNSTFLCWKKPNECSSAGNCLFCHQWNSHTHSKLFFSPA